MARGMIGTAVGSSARIATLFLLTVRRDPGGREEEATAPCRL